MSDRELVDHSAEGVHPAAKPFLFLGREGVKRNFIWLPLIGLLACSVLGVMYPQKHPLPYEENIPGSWAIYGFLAYSFIVFAAGPLFKLLARDESYYGEGGLPDPDYSTEHLHEGEH
ncbi:hypothetical protein ACJ3XI_02895 [Litorimonas sp. RW-G-Af-16]|uniref:hypothetical protein n=1 Tax=Litorimonas sp. RW-G-Af-16 TaxID=3241168 RepID=UPI00390CCEDA